MCGIAGFAGAGNRHDIERMTRRLAHRGPDDEGFYRDDDAPVYLGHRRLSIVDPEGGHQPMWTADGQIGILFNGAIYNHLDLRAELVAKGHTFRSHHSDTETLLYAYREWGLDFHDRLNGMWALALYDRRRARIVLSRDRFGQKPLYYTRQADLFAFASELVGLIQHRQIQPRVSTLALQKYFAYGYIPAPHSYFEGIHKLPAGCFLVHDIGSDANRITKYWAFHIEPFQDRPEDAEARWSERLRELLARAVERRLMADVPLGVFLSGGIDSTTVAYFAQKAAPPIHSYTIGFEDKSFDESGPAGRVAAALGTHHHHQRLSWESAGTILDEVAARLDEPMGDASLIPCFLLGRFASQTVKVALGGDGCDELFAGYDPFRALRWAEIYGRAVPKPVHKAIRLLFSRMPVSHRNISLDFKIKKTLQGLSYPPRLHLPVWMGPLEPKDLGEFFQTELDLEAVYEEALAIWDQSSHLGAVDRAIQFFVRLYLQDGILAKVDRANMMHGLEVRSPFLDIDLVNFVRQIPHEFKLHTGSAKGAATGAKYLLKRAMAHLLPEGVVGRPKKGFGLPIGPWFRKGFLDWPDSDSKDGPDRAFAAKRLVEHRRGKADHRLFLWNYWLLQHFNSNPIRHQISGDPVSIGT